MQVGGALAAVPVESDGLGLGDLNTNQAERFRITYQDTPFSRTSSSTLVVEAANAVEAFVVAFDHLVRRGKAVRARLPQALDTPESRKKLVECGVPDTLGQTVIRGIVPHSVQAEGQVLSSGEAQEEAVVSARTLGTAGAVGSKPSFYIKYQDTPFNYTPEFGLVVAAEGPVEAFAVAFDHLSIQGHSVHSRLPESINSPENVQKVLSMGVREWGKRGETHIREIHPFQIKLPNSVPPPPANVNPLVVPQSDPEMEAERKTLLRLETRATILGGLAACGPVGIDWLVSECSVQSLEFATVPADKKRAMVLSRVGEELALLACDGLVQRYDDMDAFETAEGKDWRAEVDRIQARQEAWRLALQPKEMWGLLNRLPLSDTVPAWGARALWNGRGDLQLVHDRQSMLYGHDAQRKALATWVDTVGIPWLNATARRELSPTETQEVELKDGCFRLVANANSSGGYLYIAALMSPEPDLSGAKWSGKESIPEIGTRVRVAMNEFGPGMVVGRTVNEGYVGVHVHLDKLPDWFVKQTKEKRGTVPSPVQMFFGIDLRPEA